MKHSGAASKVSFAEVRALASKERWDKDLIDGLDKFLGVAILLAPAVLGPVGVAALNLLQPKDELVKLGRAAANRFAASTVSEFVARHQRLTAAYCLMTYTAFFEALDEEMPEFTKDVAITDYERNAIIRRAHEGSNPGVTADSVTVTVAIPHPATPPDMERARRVADYDAMVQAYATFIRGLAVWDNANDLQRRKLEQALRAIPKRAAEIFDAQYLAMLIEYPAFHRWAELFEFAKSNELTRDLAASLRREISLVAETTQGIDVGLRRLEDRIQRYQPPAIPDDLIRRVAEGLNAEHISRIEEPVIRDRYSEDAGESLVYPRKCDIFVPQAFQAIRYTSQRLRLELEAVWANAPQREDIGAFVLRFLESAYSTEAPLLILGHPGSGKSLLTEMVAARFAPPTYHSVRIELRDVDAEAEVQDLVERQIRRDTGFDVNWALFCGALCSRPPLIILDGYDELLQASGKVFSNYLARVQAFQRRESVQGRPVRIIITSRITLIDKAVVPEGSTVIRLLDFDEDRRAHWTTVWNDTNRPYYASTNVVPFEIGSDSPIRHLAAQPLLLLMLAVYDSSGNQLHDAQLDRTSLYHGLLIRFIERERTKGQSADAFAALTPKVKVLQLELDLERLGVAAIGMFNRRSLVIHRDDLSRDIGYFDLVQQRDAVHGPMLTQAELLLGSFFFIHESKSRSGTTDDDRAPTTFEFLHNTFGEFLTADFIVRKILEEAQVIRKLSSDPQLLHMREQHLADLPANWFARLIYASLHTRPVVWSMMREWVAHRLRDQNRSIEEFEEDLELLVTRQLADVLCGNVPPSIMQRVNDSPFESLPLLGHMAVYSLNLVLIWLALTRNRVLFEESALDASLTGCRPWDRLTNLWRSWFSLDVLTGLGDVMRAKRDGSAVVLSQPTGEPAAGTTRLEAIRNVADTLADDAVYGLAALHLFDLTGADSEQLGSAQSRLALEGIHLSDLIEIRQLRGGEAWFRSLGALARRSRRSDAAFGHYRQALEILQQLDDQAGIADTCRALGRLALETARYHEAEDLYRAAMRIFEVLDDRVALAYTYGDLGSIALSMGRLEEAQDYYRQSLERFELLNNRIGVGHALRQLSRCLERMGRLEEAEDLTRRALELMEQLGDRGEVADALGQLGRLAHQGGRSVDAEHLYRRALELFESLGDIHGSANILHQLGVQAQELGRVYDAENLYQRAQELFEQLGNLFGAAETLYLRAGIASKMDRARI